MGNFHTIRSHYILRKLALQLALQLARLLALPPARWGCRAVEVVELCALGAENPFCGACGDYNFHKELFILYRWLWRL